MSQQAAMLWEAMKWAHATRLQIARIREDFPPFRQSRVGSQGVRRVMPADEGPAWTFWSDVHHLFVSAANLMKAVKGIDELPPDLGRAITILRNCLEHWERAGSGGGAWKGLRDEFGEFASPMSVAFGPDQLVLSDYAIDVNEMDGAVSELFDRLVALEAAT